MLAQLQRDGGADHRLLPFQRHGQPAHPFAPLVYGAGQHPVERGGDMAGKAFVRSQEEVAWMFQAEKALFLNVADRRVGGHAHDHGFGFIADVAGPPDRAAGRVAPVAGRPQPNPNAGPARKGPDDAGKGHRAKAAAPVAVIGAEVDDLDRGSGPVALDRFQHGGIAQVALLGPHRAFQFDGPIAMIRFLSAQQGREQRIAVDAGDAAPDHPPRRVDQGADLAIADGPEIE